MDVVDGVDTRARSAGQTARRAAVGMAARAALKSAAAAAGVSVGTVVLLVVGVVVIVVGVLMGAPSDERVVGSEIMYRVALDAAFPAVVSADKAEEQYRVPWGLMAAIALVLDREVDTRAVAAALTPTFMYRDSEVRFYEFGDHGERILVRREKVKLVVHVECYEGTWTLSYVWRTRVSGAQLVEYEARSGSTLCASDDVLLRAWQAAGGLAVDVVSLRYLRELGMSITSGESDIGWLAGDVEEYWAQSMAAGWDHGWRSVWQGRQGAWVSPADGPVISEYGWRLHPIYGDQRFHHGVDIGAAWGTAVRAANRGLVLAAGLVSGYGLVVVIDHGGGLFTLYAHLSSITVTLGEEVEPGEVIGQVGATGVCLGAHLHFEVRQDGVSVDPREIIVALGAE